MTMAKKASAEGGNLSEMVRTVLKEHPELKPAGVVELLAGKGIEVKVGLVNAVKSKEKAKQKEALGSFLDTPLGKTVAPVPTATVDAADAISVVKEAAKKVGGLAALQKIVVALHKD
jgi:hypothetical protein